VFHHDAQAQLFEEGTAGKQMIATGFWPTITSGAIFRACCSIPGILASSTAGTALIPDQF